MKWLVRIAKRSRHNDYDYSCRYWWGDRSARGETSLMHREMNGEPVAPTRQRCLICNPYPAPNVGEILQRTREASRT